MGFMGIGSIATAIVFDRYNNVRNFTINSDVIAEYRVATIIPFSSIYSKRSMKLT